MDILGIDIGGSGIKGAPVNVKKGVLTSDRFRIPTPQPATPDAVGDTVAAIVKHFGWKGPVGCTFPAAIKGGAVLTAANVDKSWIGAHGKKLLEKKTGRDVVLVNDADAAGMAEMRFGSGKGCKGVVFVLTFGTGVGSAVFVDGVLVPNTELGHIYIKKCDSDGPLEAEAYVSDRIRQEQQLRWEEWATRVTEYLAVIEALFFPDLFIIGGGVSKRCDQFLPLLRAQAEIVPARLLNEAGIVGAALAAKTLVKG